MMSKIGVFVVSAILLYGCALSQPQSRILKSSQDAKSVNIVSDSLILAVLKIKPKLKLPFKLAVYLEPHEIGKHSVNGWQWSENDMLSLDSLKNKLISQNIISDLVIIQNDIVGNNNISNIRLSAARLHADVVLRIKGTENCDTYSNAFSILYLTIIGFWVVPATNCDVKFVVEGSLWDVENEYLYISEHAEALETECAPVALIRHGEIISRAKEKSVNLFFTQLSEKISKLKY